MMLASAIYLVLSAACGLFMGAALEQHALGLAIFFFILGAGLFCLFADSTYDE